MTPTRLPVSRVPNSTRTTSNEISVLYDLCLDGAGGVLVREDPVMDRLSESIRQATISSPKLPDHPSPSSRSIERSNSTRQSLAISPIAGNKSTETIARDAKALAEVGAGPLFSSEMVDDDMTSHDEDLSLEDDIIMDDESHPLSPRERADIKSLATFFDSIHLQDGGSDTNRSSAVKFLLWGISPFIKMISTTLRRLAETGARDLDNFVAAARVLAGAEGDEVEVEDPSTSSTHSTSMQANFSAFSW
jgi:hypothetical protein